MSQQAHLYSVDRDDELDLIGLWKIAVKYKIAVIVTIAITVLASFYYASNLPIVYKVEVLMLPSKDDRATGATSNISVLANAAGFNMKSSSGMLADEALARLKTKSFILKYIKQKKIKHILYANQWNEDEMQWIGDEPTNQDATLLLLDMLNIERNLKDLSGLVTLSLKWSNPIHVNKIAVIANDLVDSINFQTKQRAITESKNNINFLKKELGQTSVISSQAILYSMIERQMHKIMLANVSDEYVFKVIDPAINPRYPEKNYKKWIIFIGFILGLIISMLFSVIHSSYRNNA